jgi:hypothetical protein
VPSDEQKGWRRARVATIEQCMTALKSVLGDLAANPAAKDLDRSLSCRFTDLGQVALGRLRDQAVQDLHVVPDEPSVPKADIRFEMKSDDLIELTEGRLHFGSAWAHGRIKIHAGVRDLFRLRKLL